MRRRRVRVALAVVAVIVLAGGILTAYAASTYQPLSYGTSFACCADDPSPVRSTRFVGGELRNEGRLDVRVKRVEAPQGFEVRLDLRRAPGEEIDDRGVRPFRPFKLQAGGWRYMALRARLPGCARMPRAATLFGDIKVYYEAASGVIERAVVLDLGMGLGMGLGIGAVNGRRCVFVGGLAPSAGG